MRIWSLHPKYLDTQRLVSAWREGLLAKKVLQGKTTGYKNHPQLDRFKKLKNPVQAINKYLAAIYAESIARGYDFDKRKIDWSYDSRVKIPVTSGQLDYKKQLLLFKIRTTDSKRYNELRNERSLPKHNNLFKVTSGGVESWEKVKPSIVKLLSK